MIILWRGEQLDLSEAREILETYDPESPEYRELDEIIDRYNEFWNEFRAYERD